MADDETPERIWTCSHVGEYGYFFPNASEAKDDYGGRAVEYVRVRKGGGDPQEGIEVAGESDIEELEIALANLSRQYDKRGDRVKELEVNLARAISQLEHLGFDFDCIVGRKLKRVIQNEGY